MKNLPFLAIGMLFGIVMYKSEAASWYRIFEMFRFEAFHMYGIIGSALSLGIILTLFLKRGNIKTPGGASINIQDKNKSIPRYLFGGIIFGLGWALAGACPGPLYVLVGTGVWSILVVIFSAILGTFLYGMVRHKLPH